MDVIEVIVHKQENWLDFIFINLSVIVVMALLWYTFPIFSQLQ